MKKWRAEHRDKVRQYELARNPRRERLRKQRYYQPLTRKVIAFLGGRCSSPSCRWVNEDGSTGCTDERALQIDHVNGGGTKEKKTISRIAFLRKVLSDVSHTYQLLCANCNWIKRHEKNEVRGRHGFDRS
jgi:hypothetical protein